MRRCGKTRAEQYDDLRVGNADTRHPLPCKVTNTVQEGEVRGAVGDRPLLLQSLRLPPAYPLESRRDRLAALDKQGPATLARGHLSGTPTRTAPVRDARLNDEQRMAYAARVEPGLRTGVGPTGHR